MKFAKSVSSLGLQVAISISVTDFLQYRELEQDLVPEWRAKYLDYKV